VSRGDDALRLLSLAFAATAALTLLAGLLIAVTIPIHSWDALAYGEWSRLIAEHWSLRFPEISAQTYHRPLFYVLQGVLWGVFGFHEWIGRLLSLGFTVLLFGTTAWLAARGPRFAPQAVVAAILLCLMPDVLRGIASGLTDLPLAAVVGLTAALAWTDRLPAARPYLVGASACLAVLMKPTAVVALVALAAVLLLWPRGSRRSALLRGAVPVAVGTAIALTYDLVQARHLGIGLLDFLRAGSTGVYEQLARESRYDQLVGLQWLGPDLRPLLVFALVYAGLRVAGLEHRPTTLVALVATPVLSLALPVLAGDGSGVESSVASSGAALGFAALCASLVGALWCPRDDEPEPDWLGRLLLLGGIPAVVWLLYGAYDSRLGSAAWPGLVALVAVTFTPALIGLARRAPAALAVPGVALVAFAAYGYTELDDLGDERWRTYQSLGTRVFNEAETRNLVQPQLTELVELAAAELGPDERLASAAGQFRFYFPGRVTQGYPAGCADLRGYGVFVLLTDEGTQAYMRDVARVPADPAYWEACTSPPLTEVATLPGYVFFRVGS
jgi:hypothetical protein